MKEIIKYNMQQVEHIKMVQGFVYGFCKNKR